MRPFNNNPLRWKADSAVFPSLPAPFPCPPSLPPAATRCELYPWFASVALPEAGGRWPQTVSAAGQGNTVSAAAHRQADRQLAVSLAAPTTPAATRWHALGSQPRPAPAKPTLGAAPFHLFPGTNRPAGEGGEGREYLRTRKGGYCLAVFIASNADSEIVLCIPFLPKQRFANKHCGRI